MRALRAQVHVGSGQSADSFEGLVSNMRSSANLRRLRALAWLHADHLPFAHAQVPG